MPDLLLSFLECSDLARTQVRDVLRLVELALDECDEDDERYPYLVALEEQLLQGTMPRSRLSSFLMRFPRRELKVEPVDLEGEFRAIAEELPEMFWCTAAYVELEKALDDFDEEGDELRLLDYLEVRREALHQVLDGYGGETVVPEEVTSESVVGHRLLLEGLGYWLESLDLAQVGLQQRETSWEGCLEAAERGNRLLLAVQKLHRRVVSQVPLETSKEGAVF